MALTPPTPEQAAALRERVDKLLADGEQVMEVLKNIEDLPALSKVKPFIDDLGTVLSDVVAFLEGAVK